MLDRRLMEAEKLGFTHVVIPAWYEWKIPNWLTVTKVRNIKELTLGN
jgi:predicted ATP-dependent serine protease